VPAAPPAVDSGELCPRIDFADLGFFFLGIFADLGSVPVFDVPTAPPAVEDGAELCALAIDMDMSVAAAIMVSDLIMDAPWTLRRRLRHCTNECD
jgi:hypothetical protein